MTKEQDRKLYAFKKYAFNIDVFVECHDLDVALVALRTFLAEGWTSRDRSVIAYVSGYNVTSHSRLVDFIPHDEISQTRVDR